MRLIEMSRLFMYIGNSSNYTALVIITDHSMIIPNSQFLAASCVPLKWQDHEAADTANTQKVDWYGTAIKSNDSHNVFYDDIQFEQMTKNDNETCYWDGAMWCESFESTKATTGTDASLLLLLWYFR